MTLILHEEQTGEPCALLLCTLGADDPLRTYEECTTGRGIHLIHRTGESANQQTSRPGSYPPCVITR